MSRGEKQLRNRTRPKCHGVSASCRVGEGFGHASIAAWRVGSGFRLTRTESKHICGEMQSPKSRMRLQLT
jgi:hypothetical protein